MRLYHPGLLYLLIAAGAIVTAALVWTVDRLWPGARTDRPGAGGEVIESTGGPAHTGARPAPEPGVSEVSGTR
ncbi:MAG TPA: hypothetical protein VFU43_29990 [Streptosporangiaceae bacterium]|nr:hypothetical protein [Streptosporangiaceae bacterium]